VVGILNQTGTVAEICIHLNGQSQGRLVDSD
jgi:hypothetical protein